jgi:transposase
MARRGRPTVEINLSTEERATLERWARRHSSSQALALRSKIVLACAAGAATHVQIAAELGCNAVTVGKWRNRFGADRLDGLVDAPRSGAARTIGDGVIEAVVIETLESAPPDATHWSTRSLAAKHGMSHTTVREIWRAFGLKPGREDSFKVSPDPDLVEKIRDLVGLYMSPPVAAAVFAIDERPQIQALNRTAPTLPMLPTTPARATHDYERNGTCDLFAALNVATGSVITAIKKSHTSADFIAFLNGQHRGVRVHLELLAVFPMGAPPSPEPQALPDLGAQQGSHHRQQIRSCPLGRDPGDCIAGLLVDIGEPFQNRLEHRQVADVARWAGGGDHIPILPGIPSPANNRPGIANPAQVRRRLGRARR